MRVTPQTGGPIELGTAEARPTVGITDYSRRVTDDFGVTTVVKRDFSRRLSTRLAVPTVEVDAVSRILTDLRASVATWTADDRHAWLTIRGYLEDFSFELPAAGISYCTLTLAGLAESESGVDPGTDPAPDGRTSTLRMLRPAIVTDAALAAHSAPEDDAPAWSAGITYAADAKVVRGHRVYQSLAPGNVGLDPASNPAKWLDTGPTNRWAMFDQALGTSTTSAGSIVVTLRAGDADMIALLDVAGASVRVQGNGYDQSEPAGAGAIVFPALPGGDITVTIAGPGQISVGTLLVGRVATLGITEASPTAGITDYSRKDVDEFGDVTIVPRAWAKNMAAKALIASDALDTVANRIAAARATPCLWIGGAGRDSLTIYGFFRDFSIEVGESVSVLSLSIEGLSKAPPIVPLAPGGSVAWPDITDPTGTKPTDNADKTSENTSKDTAAVGGKPAGQVLDAIDAAKARQDEFDTVIIPAINDAVADAGERIEAARQEASNAVGAANAKLDRASERLDGEDAAIRRRVEEVVGDFTDLDAATNVRIRDEVALLVGADEALGRRIDSVAAGGNYDDTAVYAEVRRVDEAAIGRDDAIARSVEIVQASYTRSAFQAAEFDPAFPLDAHWSTQPLPAKLPVARPGVAIDQAYDYASCLIAQASAGRVRIFSLATYPVDTRRRYRISARIGAYLNGGSQALGSLFYIGVVCLDGVGRVLDHGAYGDYRYSCVLGERIGDSGSMLLRSAVITGEGNDSWLKFAPGTKQVKLCILLNWAEDSSLISYVDYVRFDDAEGEQKAVDADARVSQVAVTVADAGKAAADLSRSVDTRFAGVNDTFGSYNERITSLSTAQQGYAGRTQVLEAAASVADRALNANPNFAMWSDPIAAPNGWAGWGSVTAGTYRRLTNSLGAAGYMLEHASSDINSGYVTSPVYLTVGWYVMEAEVWKTAGSWTGAGATASGAYNLDFISDPDVAEGVGDIDVSGGVRRWSKLIYVSAASYFNWHLMTNWEGFNRGNNPKTLRWLRCAVRPASDLEIKAQKAITTTIPAVAARVQTAEDTLADLPNRYAAASRTAALEAQVNFATDSGLQRAVNARIEDRATAIADAKAGAVAQTVGTLRSEYNGTVATVSQQAGTLVDLKSKATAYVKIVADAGNGRAALSLWSDQYGGAWSLTGDGLIDGNLTVNGTITTAKVADGAINDVLYIEAAQQNWNPSGAAGTQQRGNSETLYFPSPTVGRTRIDYKIAAVTNVSGNATFVLYLRDTSGNILWTQTVDNGATGAGIRFAETGWFVVPSTGATMGYYLDTTLISRVGPSGTVSGYSKLQLIYQGIKK